MFFILFQIGNEMLFFDFSQVNDTLRFYVTLEDIVGENSNNIVQVPISVIILDENDNAPSFQQVSLISFVLNCFVNESINEIECS